MLWNLVFEFYVKYIFGGVLYSNGSYTYYYGNIGPFFNSSGVPVGNWSTPNFFFKFFDDYYNLGNYLSLIATIISMIIILLIIGHFIKKTFNLFGRII